MTRVAPRGLLLALSLLLTAPAAAQTRFRFPAVDPTGDLFMQVPVIHVDHDPAVSDTGTTCLTFDGGGFPFCYDGHDGTDYLLVFGFATMDQNDVKVVAAADGEVTYAEDGNYDRCHETSGFKVTCDGHPMKANAVKIRHADGVESWYWHLKKGSVKVKVGQKVRCGDLLGHVGSSGKSATPHLHFEVRDAAGKLIDPYAGKESQPQSYWVQQDGAFGWPAQRCAGEPIPADGGVSPEAGSPTPDAGPPAQDAAPDAGFTTDDPAGCALTPAEPPPLAALALLALLALRRRTGDQSRR